MTPADFIAAARVPHSLEPQSFGTWTIERRRPGESVLFEDFHGCTVHDMALPYGLVGFPDYTLLRCTTIKSLHQDLGEVVMEDSTRELRKHLPIWMSARGHVLVTGLGLGCVVRGLLANPAVEHVDVVEIDEHIFRIIGAEFRNDPRVTLHLADALTWEPAGQCWDYAWHDLHDFGEECLHRMHMDLFLRYKDACPLECQGAWAWPREFNRRMPIRLLGTPKVKHRSAPKASGRIRTLRERRGQEPRAIAYGAG